jgi:hypothetical protein
VHYPGAVDLISGLLADGKPLPEGLADAVKTFPEYRVKLTARKGVLE